MSDDDLPPPRGKAIVLDDDDDDLPPPQAARGANLNLDTDSGDDLPPPPVKAIILDDDDDDDLPPPQPSGLTAAALAASTKVVLDDTDDDLPAARPRTAHADPDPGAARRGATAATEAATEAAADGGGGGGGGAAAAAAAAAEPDSRGSRGAGTKPRRAKPVAELHKEGFLLKQQPTWPYASQKRWCVLKGRLLSYFENQGSAVPSGTLDLKGAELVDSVKNARMPNTFGITGSSGQLKSRMYIFAPMHRDELTGWTSLLTKAMAETKSSEIHWFDKVAQGTF